MELFLLRHHEYEQLYNCTDIQIDVVPLEKRQFPAEAVIIIVLCALYYVLYLPCMFSIWKNHRKTIIMELFFLRHHDYEILYNCSDNQIDAVPLEKRRQFPVEAVANIVLCALYYALYLPCMFSIWKNHRNNACYTILLFISCTDLMVLWIIGFLHGWLSLEGAVFCSHPTLIYVTGSLATALWVAETSADLVLALNRCLDIASPRLAKRLFKGKRTHVWLLCCSLYALYWLLFVKPLLFSGLYFAWFYNPFVGYREDPEGQFDVPMETFHDPMVAISSPLIYLLFLVAFYFKTRKFQGATVSPGNTVQKVKISKAEKITFLQVFIISSMNTVCASIYVLMQHVTPDQWLITVAQFAWLHIHGFPPVIYLTLNKTMRDDCLELIARIFKGKKSNNTTGNNNLANTILVKNAPGNVLGTTTRH